MYNLQLPRVSFIRYVLFRVYYKHVLYYNIRLSDEHFFLLNNDNKYRNVCLFFCAIKFLLVSPRLIKFYFINNV